MHAIMQLFLMELRYVPLVKEQVVLLVVLFVLLVINSRQVVALKTSQDAQNALRSLRLTKCCGTVAGLLGFLGTMLYVFHLSQVGWEGPVEGDLLVRILIETFFPSGFGVCIWFFALVQFHVGVGLACSMLLRMKNPRVFDLRCLSEIVD